MNIPFVVLITHHLIESILVVYVGLNSIGKKTSILNYLKIAGLYTIFLYLIRNLFNLGGYHIFILIIILTIEFNIITNIQIKYSLIASLFSFLSLAIGELFIPLMIKFLQLDINLIFKQTPLYILAGIVGKSLLIIVAFLNYKFDFKIIQLKEDTKEEI